MTAPDPRLLLSATWALLEGCGPGVLDGQLVLALAAVARHVLGGTP